MADETSEAPVQVVDKHEKVADDLRKKATESRWKKFKRGIEAFAKREGKPTEAPPTETDPLYVPEIKRSQEQQDEIRRAEDEQKNLVDLQKLLEERRARGMPEPEDIQDGQLGGVPGPMETLSYKRKKELNEEMGLNKNSIKENSARPAIDKRNVQLTRELRKIRDDKNIIAGAQDIVETHKGNTEYKQAMQNTLYGGEQTAVDVVNDFEDQAANKALNERLQEDIMERAQKGQEKGEKKYEEAMANTLDSQTNDDVISDLEEGVAERMQELQKEEEETERLRAQAPTEEEQNRRLREAIAARKVENIGRVEDEFDFGVVDAVDADGNTFEVFSDIDGENSKLSVDSAILKEAAQKGNGVLAVVNTRESGADEYKPRLAFLESDKEKQTVTATLLNPREESYILRDIQASASNDQRNDTPSIYVTSTAPGKVHINRRPLPQMTVDNVWHKSDNKASGKISPDEFYGKVEAARRMMADYENDLQKAQLVGAREQKEALPVVN